MKPPFSPPKLVLGLSTLTMKLISELIGFFIVFVKLDSIELPIISMLELEYIIIFLTGLYHTLPSLVEHLKNSSCCLLSAFEQLPKFRASAKE